MKQPHLRYYIHHDSGQLGPLDLLGVIRKIRNGSLQKNDMLASDAQENAIPAYQHAELYEVFIEQDRFQQEAETMSAANEISFGALLKSSFTLLKDDQTGMMIAGLYLLATVFTVGALAISLPAVIAAVIAPTLGMFFFNLYLVITQRVARVQLLSGSFFSILFRKYGVSLFLSGLPAAVLGFTLPWIASLFLGMGAWALTFFIGLPVLAYSFFVPIILIDQEVDVKEAFKRNHHLVKSLGLSLFSFVIGMMLLNLVAAGVVVPLLFTLPLTIMALTQLYDESYGG